MTSIVDDPYRDRWRKRIHATDERAVVDGAVRGAQRSLGPTLVLATVRAPASSATARSTSSAASSITDISAVVESTSAIAPRVAADIRSKARSRSLYVDSRSDSTFMRVAPIIASTERSSSRSPDARHDRTRRRVGVHRQSPRSTITGAWSDGDWPLRAFRSITVHSARSATARLAITRSMRSPRPWWKSPAR